MTNGAVLSFGLAHIGSSEFELMAEELLMSDSVIKASIIFSSLFYDIMFMLKMCSTHAHSTFEMWACSYWLL